MKQIVLCFLAILAIAETNSSQCRMGYTMNNGACYKFMNQKNTRSVASANCKAAGGNLATISSNATNQFLVGLGKPYIKEYVYNGLQCPNVTFNGDASSCVWDDGTPFTYNAFLPGQPNIDFIDASLACIDFNNGRWHSYPCEYILYSICELRV